MKYLDDIFWETERNSLFSEPSRILDYYELYAEEFLLVAGICFVARDIGRGAAVDEAALAGRIAGLESYQLRLVELFGSAWHPHQLQLLMNPVRIGKIIGEARSLLNKKRPAMQAWPASAPHGRRSLMEEEGERTQEDRDELIAFPLIAVYV